MMLTPREINPMPTAISVSDRAVGSDYLGLQSARRTGDG
jgi:hypothetical protein